MNVSRDDLVARCCKGFAKASSVALSSRFRSRLSQAKASEPGVDLSEGVLLLLVCRAIAKQVGAVDEPYHAR